MRMFLQSLSQERNNKHDTRQHLLVDIIQIFNLTLFINGLELPKNTIKLRDRVFYLIIRQSRSNDLYVLQDIIDFYFQNIEQSLATINGLRFLFGQNHFYNISIQLFYSSQLYFLIDSQIMNQNVGLQERKSNINRQNSITSASKGCVSSCEIKRKISSAVKKKSEVEDNYMNKQLNKYLIGWGKLPCLDNPSNEIQIINKDISFFSTGQEHVIFMSIMGQIYGVGSNKYGQLGVISKANSKNVINRLFQQTNVKRIFSTNYNTFVINQHNEVFGCGLNNRGQLGLGYTKQKIENLTMIERLNENRQCQQMKRKSSRSKINSLFYQQQRKSNDEYQSKGKSLLQMNQSIMDIQGGPFHTIVLTSKGRVLYTGNIYNRKSIENDQFSMEFNELNTLFLGKTIAIKSFLTGICFLTLQNRLFLLGIFGKHIFDEPEMLDNINIVNFDINQEGIFIVDVYGDLLLYNLEKDKLKAEKIYINSKVKGLYCGLDYVIIVNKEGNVLGKGDNSQRQLCNVNQNYVNSFQDMQITLSEEQCAYLRCSNNFVIGLTSKLPSIEVKKQNQSKTKDIQRENKILKELLCNKNKKNVKTQTDKQSKFDIVKPMNARTFDTSLEIPFEEITLGKQISEGGYGIIYKATWRKSLVAVKIFKIEKQNENAVRDFMSECHAMEALRHPNIVMFLGACTKPPHFAIVLEYCEGGTLWTLLQKSNLEISWQERRNFALDIAKGMNYLHERAVPIIHRDLKSLNLLFDANKRIKLADFGWTKGLQNYMTGKIGTYQWMAPEVISAYQYTEKADIFSFGIILWEIAARQAPYRNIPGPQVAQDVLLKDLRPTIPKKTPEQFIQLIRRCWSKDAPSRPSFNSIISILQEMSFH